MRNLMIFVCYWALCLGGSDQNWKALDVKCTYELLNTLNYSCGIEELEISVSNIAINFSHIEDIKKAEKVTWLSIKSSFTTYMPHIIDAFKAFPKLEEFSISNSQLRFVERIKLKLLKGIKVLILSDNEIEEIPEDSFDDLSELTFLTVDGNKIKNLHENLLAKLTNLEGFSAYGNIIEVLPAGLFKFNKNLRDVILFDNKLMKIHIDFSKMPKIQQIWLNYNPCVNAFYCDVEGSCSRKYTIESFQKLLSENC